MKTRELLITACATSAMLAAMWLPEFPLAETTAATTTVAADATADTAVLPPQPLTDEELQILVARIALYPDELVAVISASALYPLDLIEASRFLESSKTNKDLKPDPNWDGSVISLMNYPDIVKMMSDDLDWTQALGDAIVNQQDDVLNTIQLLREKAVAEGVLKTDEKMTVDNEGDNIVVQPTNPEAIYIPTYPPEMLYTPGYVYPPIDYHDNYYPPYYYPSAPFFAGVVTGVVWAGIVDWDDGIWGGNWDGGDLDIDCNNCFNDRDFNGKVKMNDVDWKNVDRSKVNFDKNEIKKLDKTEMKTNLKSNDRNNTRINTGEVNRKTTTARSSGKPVTDVRKSTLDGLKANPTAKPKVNKPASSVKKPSTGVSKPKSGNGTAAGNYNRPTTKAKPAAKVDSRPKKPSPTGSYSSGRSAKSSSSRGSSSRGGGGGARVQRR